MYIWPHLGRDVLRQAAAEPPMSKSAAPSSSPHPVDAPPNRAPTAAAPAGINTDAVDGELARAQKIASDLESAMNGSVAAAEAVEAQSLPDLDKAMSSDLDAMLQGNFESVDTVLDGVFDHQATLVQSADGTPAMPPYLIQRGKTSQLKQPADARMVSEDVPLPARAPTTVFEEPPAAPKPIERAHVADAQQADAREQPLASDVTAHHATAASDFETVVQPETQIAPAYAQPAVADVIVDEADDFDAGADAAPALEETRSQVADTLLLRVLAVLNKPWSGASQSTQAIINWVAISMLAWVPIVWIIVIMSRSATPSGATHTPDQHATPTAHSDASAPAQPHRW